MKSICLILHILQRDTSQPAGNAEHGLNEIGQQDSQVALEEPEKSADSATDAGSMNNDPDPDDPDPDEVRHVTHTVKPGLEFSMSNS